MGKKKVEEMAKERAKFAAGALEHHGIEPRVSGLVFDLLENFAGYGSITSPAAAYTLLPCPTSTLKVLHPAQFMAAVLPSHTDTPEKSAILFSDTRAPPPTALPPTPHT